MAILGALNSLAVHRLKWTRSELPPVAQKTLVDLEKTMSSDSSFKTYRDTLMQCQPPCIPYLGTYLTDLVFVDENPDFIGNLINFSKRRLVYHVICQFLQYRLPYPIMPVYQVNSLLSKLPQLDEAELFSLSLAREPRKANRNEIL